MPATNNDYIYEAVSVIRDKALSKLEETHTPAYPKYYRKMFEEIMASDTDETLSQIYERIKNRDETDETLFNRYIDLVELSINSFSGSHNTLQSLALAQGEVIESLKDEEGSDSHAYTNLLNIITSFQRKLIEELAHAEEKIVTLENKLQETIAETMLDPLTRAFNRKALEHDLALLIHHAQQNPQHKLAILMVDGDDFKVINDTHGHLIGDKILIFMASTIKASLRSDNRVYRYGGEEFVVLLNGLDDDVVANIANRIREKIETSRLIYGEETIGFTVSLGVAHFHPDDTFETFIKRADDALYKAKSQGKNCVWEY